MGLDFLELVLDVEDHFGISIKDVEAERLHSVGDLVALIQSRIEASQAKTCPTLSSFLQLRSCVRDIASNDKLRIRAGTRIVDVLSRSERQRLWRHLDDVLGATPPLRHPPMMRILFRFCVLATMTLAIVFASATEFSILPLTFAFALSATLVLHFLTRAFRVVPPDALTTFGELSRWMANLSIATKQLHLRSPSEILDELKPIVAESIGVSPSVIVPSLRFIEDLGMG